ncbi:MAG: hypothetical protein ACK41W_12475 [Cyanobacteriota bacterium]|jgi:hypothetical protein
MDISWRSRLLNVVLVLCLALLVSPGVGLAAELRVEGVSLAPCPSDDAGNQPLANRSRTASCYALRGEVVNSTGHAVVDTDLFAVILDSSGEPVLPNRSRVGGIGDVPPGRSSFALRFAVPANTPGPFRVGQVKARGFNAPVRTRPVGGEEQLPLEQQLGS